MLDGLGSQGDFPPGAFNDFCHRFSSVQDFPRLLVLVNVNRHFIHQLLIHLLVFRNQRQQSVDFSVQGLVFVQIQEMPFPQFLFLWNYYVQLILLNPDVGFDFIQSPWKLFSFAHFVVQVCHVFLHFLLVPACLLVQVVVSQFHLGSCVLQWL